MKDLQEKLYAQDTYGLIIVLQAMDAAGKDGTVNHVFANLDPGGVKVVSFKQPTSEEKDHDYMWRINKALPERGDIGIFNRSQYEDVIVTRIHDLIHKGQLPQDLIHKDFWEERYEQINNWEKYLHQNGFQMVKSSFMYRRRNSSAASWTASSTSRRTGNSPCPILTKDSTGTGIRSSMRK